MDSHQEVLVSNVLELYEKISSFEDLNPSKDVNACLSKLVHTCLSSCHIDVSKLSERVQEKVSRLIKLCGEAEGLLEMHFSTLIGSHEYPLKNLSLFPYYSNYLKLSHLEFTLLSKACKTIPTNVAFVGSGPLPLSSIILATNHLKTTSFHNYDIDPSANAKALQLVSPDPDLSKRMFFHTTDIMNVLGDLKEHEVIFLAALVGMDWEEKARIIQHLAAHMSSGSILLLRSAHGARAFLYPVIDPNDLQGFEVLSIFHPTDDIVNSVIMARKDQRPLCSCKGGGFNSTNLPSKCSEIQGFIPVNHGKIFEELTMDEQTS
ncbi:hypothetical protein SLE2022_254090 [Rubroshorea leprosula]